MTRHTRHHGIDGSIDCSDGLGDLDRRDFLRSVGAATALGLLGTASDPGGAAAIENSGDGEPVLWQAFHMEWTEIESRIDLYADTGFDAIWVPQPATCKLSWRHQAREGENGFYENEHPRYGDLEPHPPLGYQPVDLLDFDSPYGTEVELRSMIETAHAHDVEVILDCVLNHVATRDAPADRWGDAEDSNQEWEEVTIPWSEYNFGPEHFYDQGELGEGCSDMFRCSLLGLPDLDVSHPHVQDVHEQYIRKLADVGADGLRFDAAQHVLRDYWRNHINPLCEELDLWRVGETWHADPTWCLSFADTGMHVFDYPLYGRIVDGFEKGDLYQCTQQGEQNNGVVHQNPDAAVTFVQNHDARAPGMTPVGTPEGALEDVANAFVLSYPGTTQLFRDDLEDPALRDLIWIKRNLASGEVIDRYPGYGAYIYEREGNLLAGINVDGYEHTHTVTTAWADQQLTDYANNGPDVTTDGSGEVAVTIAAESWVMYAPPGQRDDGGGGGGGGGGGDDGEDGDDGDDGDDGTPAFSVSNLSHPASATLGDAVTVSATVGNTGDGEGSTTVDLLIDGSVAQTTEVTLTAGGTTSVSFEYDTMGLSSGTHTVAVSAVDASVSGTIDLSGDADSTLASWSDPTGEPLGPGTYTAPTAGDFYEDAWDVATVEIEAPSSTEYRFRIEISGGIQDPGGWGGQGGMAHQFPQFYIRNPEASGGSTAARTGVNADLATPWHSVVLAHGFGLAAVEDASGARVAEATLTVDDPWIEITVPRSTLDVDLSTAEVAPVMCAKGDIDGEVRRVDATASSWNFGGGAGDSATMGTDPNVLDVVPPAGTSQEAALAYTSSSRASIPYRAVSDDGGDGGGDDGGDDDGGDGDDNDDGGSAVFDVSNLAHPATATVGETITVSADVTNTGDATDMTSAALLVDGTVADSRSGTLQPGETTTISFEYDTATLAAGTHAVAVAAGDQRVSGSIDITGDGGDSVTPFEVQKFSSPSAAEPGWTVYVSADVVNTGSEPATKTVEFRVDGTVVESLERQLSENSQSWVEFGFDTSGLAAGEYTVTIATPDDSASEVVTIS